MLTPLIHTSTLNVHVTSFMRSEGRPFRLLCIVDTRKNMKFAKAFRSRNFQKVLFLWSLWTHWRRKRVLRTDTAKHQLYEPQISSANGREKNQIFRSAITCRMSTINFEPSRSYLISYPKYYGSLSFVMLAIVKTRWEKTTRKHSRGRGTVEAAPRVHPTVVLLCDGRRPPFSSIYVVFCWGDTHEIMRQIVFYVRCVCVWKR